MINQLGDCSEKKSIPEIPRFIIGVPRSGTTLLANLISQYDQLAVLSEPFLPLAIPGDFRRKLFCRKLASQAGVAYHPPPLDGSPLAFLDYLKYLMDTKNSTLIIKETYRSGYDLQNLPLFDMLVTEGFPVVGIRRHPLSVVASSLRFYSRFRGLRRQVMRFAVPNLPDYGSDAELAAYTAKNWLSYDRWCRDNGVGLVGYEDLIRDPETNLGMVISALKLSDECSGARMQKSRLPGLGDSRGMRLHEADATDISAQAVVDLPESIIRVARDITAVAAESYGYDFPCSD